MGACHRNWNFLRKIPDFSKQACPQQGWEHERECQPLNKSKIKTSSSKAAFPRPKAMNDGLKMNIISPPQVNLINLNRCAHEKGGIPISFPPSAPCHRLAWLAFSLHTQWISQALGPGRNSLGSTSVSGLPRGEQLLFLVFLFWSRYQDIYT